MRAKKRQKKKGGKQEKGKKQSKMEKEEKKGRHLSGVFHAEKSRYLQYLISAGRKWERIGRYTNTKSDGS